MKFKLLGTAAIIAAMVSGAALAQNVTHPRFESEDEKIMYENTPSAVIFFTDSSQAELRSEAEVKTAYEALTDQDRDKIRKDCERVAQKRGSYGTVTQSLCEQVMSM